MTTSVRFPWLMVYHRSDGISGGNGGYPWDGRGVLLRPVSEPVFLLQIYLDVQLDTSNSAQFYLPEFSGCWKDDGTECDGDLITDVTRYGCFILHSPAHRACQPTNQRACPRWHVASDGARIYRNDTKLFPYQCYHNWCGPPNSNEIPANEKCDPYSNPVSQELMQIVPCAEWGAYGFPARDGEGWIGDPRVWQMNVGGLGNKLAWTGVEKESRTWLSFEVGPENFAVNQTFKWTITDWDVLVQN